MNKQMQSCDILLFKAEESIFSKIIAWGTNSKYSHVAVCVSPEMNLAIEAMTRGGVRARDIRKIKAHYDVYRVKKEYPYDVNETISCLVSKLNSKYDYRGVFYLGFLKLLAKLKLPTKNLANRWQKQRDYFCSELCYEVFKCGGVNLVPKVAGSDITSPGDIARSDVVELVCEGKIEIILE